MDISVIIATYNRASILQGTLESLAALQPQGISHEIIVVDNNSSDNTKAVVEEFAERAPIRYLFEERQGKNYALNTGVEAAQGELLVFTDDDVYVPADWLDRYWEAAREHPEAAYFGGTIVPVLPPNAPRWMHAPGIDLVNYDVNNRDYLLDGSLGTVCGPNMAFRRAVFASGLRFDEAVGPGSRAGRLLSEASLLAKVHSAGLRGAAVGGAAVRHRIDLQPRFLSIRYHLARRFAQARGGVHIGFRYCGSRRFLGIRVLPTLDLGRAVLRMLFAWLRPRADLERVSAEMEVADRAGIVWELVTQSVSRVIRSPKGTTDPLPGKPKDTQP
jgi:glycosyltransferase involved in cell wall biosynthesis